MKVFLVLTIGLLGGTGVCGATPIPSTGCAATAEAAVARLLAKQGAGDERDGYRVASVRFDVVQNKRWAMVASCLRPASPLTAIELRVAPGEVTNVARVQLGESVRVVSRDGESSVEIAGWSQGAGEVGDVIRVRVPRLSDDATEPAPQIRCRVVGPGVVEVAR